MSQRGSQVSLPNLWAVNFTRLELEDGYELENLSDLNLPIYVSIGNSITHGTGQYVSSAKTYPFILAQKSNWNLHNLAVAGATLGWAIAKNIKNQKVDVITILLGFNDWKYTTSPLQNKKLEYEKLLDSLRHYQPNAKIYCITPLFSSDKNGSAPYTLQEFRDMVTELVSAKQQNDKNICLINGPSISDASMLASGDPVHLSESGANTLAQNLFIEIENCNLTSIFPVKPAWQNCIEIEKINPTQIHFKTTCAGNHTLTLASLEGKIIYQESIDVSSINLKLDNIENNLFLTRTYNQGLKVPIDIYVNGMQVDVNYLMGLDAKGVESIEVFYTDGLSGINRRNNTNGVLAINMIETPKVKITKEQLKELFPPTNVITIQPKGYAVERQFYVPKFSGPKTSLQREDYRTTIHWEPIVVTDKTGKGTFSFYNSDAKGPYRVTIEGVDANGNIGRTVYKYQLK